MSRNSDSRPIGNFGHLTSKADVNKNVLYTSISGAGS